MQTEPVKFFFFFFSVKIHNPERPFRAILSIKSTWPRLLGRHLQRDLMLLPVNAPFLVKDSGEVCGVLEGFEMPTV